jgi:3-oxoacyl-[acyl-carrier protein] reductase
MHSGKVALVTGASRGIGKAIALLLASQGAQVIGSATSPSGAQAISDYFQEANHESCVGHQLNVTDMDSIAQLMGFIKENYSPIAILVNNAAVTNDNLFMRMKSDEWDNVIKTNLDSVYHMSKSCIRGMLKARWGRIVNIGSIVGSCGNLGQANYCAAKAGVVGMSKAIALEVATRNITVNVVAPGFVDTDMTQELPDEHRELLLKQVPMGRIGVADDIAKMVSFLASSDASYITGQTLHVNGGMLMD